MIIQVRTAMQAETPSLPQNEKWLNRSMHLMRRQRQHISGGDLLRQRTCLDLNPHQERLYGNTENFRTLASKSVNEANYNK